MPIRPLLSKAVGVPHGIVRVLEQAGIDHVFGMPGGRTSPIFNALYDRRDSIRAVLVREEGLATVMADVYGRLTGRPGVAMGQAAFLLTNAGMGILEGLLAGSPMLLLTDLSDGSPYSQHAPYQAGTADHGTWDARATIAGYTKQVFVAHEPAQAIQDTQLAIKHALAGQPGPVAVLYHSAALGAEVGPQTTPRLYDTSAYLPRARHEANADQIASTAQRLRAGQRPVVLAGNGVRISHAQSELRRLAERLDAPVATTASGKGVFSETHPLALGVFGNFGLEAANAVIAESDLVLAVGTKLGPTDTANEHPGLLDPQRQALIQIDVEPRNAAWSFPADEVLVGDAGAILRQLAEALGPAPALSADGRASRALEAHRRYASFDDAESASDEVPILPQRLIKELHRALPDDAIVTCDAGENRLFMLHHFQTKGSMEYLQPAGVGGMGYAIPAALAARLVYPDRAAVAVCGDGGFGIAMNGLLTALEERIPLVTIVFNNSMLGWVRHGQGERPIASGFGQFDYAAIVRAMGCLAIRVEQPADLAGAFERALAAGQPAVVDVVTSARPTFRDVTSPLVAPRLTPVTGSPAT
jgi:acetolactate synthase-1/2/3 large subunit